MTTGPNDFYIVVALPITEFATFDEAMTAREMMQRHLPDKMFRVFRCKRWMSTAKHFGKLVQFLADLVTVGSASPEMMTRARLILSTIRVRNDLKFLDENYLVPEFDPEEARPT